MINPTGLKIVRYYEYQESDSKYSVFWFNKPVDHTANRISLVTYANVTHNKHQTTSMTWAYTIQITSDYSILGQNYEVPGRNLAEAHQKGLAHLFSVVMESYVTRAIR